MALSHWQWLSRGDPTAKSGLLWNKERLDGKMLKKRLCFVTTAGKRKHFLVYLEKERKEPGTKCAGKGWLKLKM